MPNVRLALGGILLLALVARVPYLTRTLAFDELWATHVMLSSLSGTWHLIGSDTHPGFYTAFIFGWMCLFGDSEIAIRLPSLLFGLGAVWLAYVLGRRWAGQATGLLAALLLTLSPAAIWYSQEARPYSLEVFSVLLLIRSYYGLLDAPAARRGRWLVGYAAIALATVQTDWFLLAFPAALTLLCHARRFELRRTMAVINLLVALSLAAFLVAQYFKVGIVTDAYYLRPFTPFELWMLFFHWFSTGNALWSVNPYAGPAALLADPVRLTAEIALALIFLKGLVAIVRGPASGGDLLLLLFAMPLPVMALSVWPFNSIYIERGLIAALPLYLIVLARGAVGTRRTAAALAVKGFLLALSGAAMIAMYARPDDWTVYQPRPDWRSLAAYLDVREPNAQPMPIVSVAPALELIYYRPWIQATNTESALPVPSTSGDSREIANLIAFEPGTSPCDYVATRRAGGLILVHNSTWDVDITYQEALASLNQSADCRLQETRSFKGLQVFLFTRGGGQ